MRRLYVGAYVKTNKSDAADMQMFHRAQDLLIRQRTMPANTLRNCLAELGITAGHGTGNVYPPPAIGDSLRGVGNRGFLIHCSRLRSEDEPETLASETAVVRRRSR